MAPAPDPEILKHLQELAMPHRGGALALAEALAAFRFAYPGRLKLAFAACGLKPAKGHALTRIGRRLPELGPDRSRLEAIGWAKLDILLPYLAPDNAGALLALAEQHSQLQLAAILRGQGPPVGMERIAFDLTRDQADMLRFQLRFHGARDGPRGLKRKEAALMRLLGVICLCPQANGSPETPWKKASRQPPK